MEEERKQFSAVCSECGKKCKIPFEPVEERPVKCDDCFKRRDSGGRGRRFKKRDFRVTCAECGKNTTVPFKPVMDKPVLCRECFDKGN